jgi:phospholipase C
MKLAIGIVLVLFSSAALTRAQDNLPHFSHIIIVIQENRTPDNLFGSYPSKTPGCGTEDPFESGVDIENGGYAKINNQRQLICNISLSMNGQDFDPNHTYVDGWVPQYDGGGLDGFCQIVESGQCVQYSYVQASDVSEYFNIASAYGFANYMFQTNEGPSFPAHQFLFTGTSAPVAPLNNYYQYFVAENGSGDGNSSGCAQTGNDAAVVDPIGAEHSGSVECYPHDSLVTNASGDKGVSWRYYTPTAKNIWTAPASIPEVCYGTNSGYTVGQACSGNEWNKHLVFPITSGGGGAPILTDIQNCNLQDISWVIPDEQWSDHGGYEGGPTPPYGPSWVANIVDAVGNSWSQSQGGGKCDYWGTYGPNPEPTAIFVVWDDWGGWFDHVPPYKVYRGQLNQQQQPVCTNENAPNGWGCGFVYGFRVPFLVVSEYTGAGYVSGGCTSDCPNEGPGNVHDFGSILAFIENNFGMLFIDQGGDSGYADRNAPDGANGNVPLSDFFELAYPRLFTNITPFYPPSTFEGFYDSGENTPTGPDGGSSD